MKRSRQFGLVTLLAVLLLAAMAWHSGDMASLWLTADQRGWLAFRQKDYAAAAERFADPQWGGTAYAAAGEYLNAAEVFARSADATGFYNRGIALIRAREYAQAIASFELALEEAPDFPDAAANLELSRYILDYLETAREQSGTDGQLGADEYRYDASAERGESAVIDDSSDVRTTSAEKWMRSVDTETSEFLTLRFALEANRREVP